MALFSLRLSGDAVGIFLDISSASCITMASVGRQSCRHNSDLSMSSELLRHSIDTHLIFVPCSRLEIDAAPDSIAAKCDFAQSLPSILLANQFTERLEGDKLLIRIRFQDQFRRRSYEIDVSGLFSSLSAHMNTSFQLIMGNVP